MLKNADILTSPLEDFLTSAKAISAEAFDGELGSAAAAAYERQIAASAASAGLSRAELEGLNAPQSWFQRLTEGLQDWWWQRRAAQRPADLEDVLAFPVPLLQTRPLQDIPAGYEEIDARMAAFADELASATDACGWQRMAWSRPSSENEDFEFSPLEHLHTIWRHPQAQSYLAMTADLEEDPKLMGMSLGLVHLTGHYADALDAALG